MAIFLLLEFHGAPTCSIGAAPRWGLVSSSLGVVAFPAGMERMMRRLPAAIHYAR
jgi:hypothetical protein